MLYELELSSFNLALLVSSIFHSGYSMHQVSSVLNRATPGFSVPWYHLTPSSVSVLAGTSHTLDTFLEIHRKNTVTARWGTFSGDVQKGQCGHTQLQTKTPQQIRRPTMDHDLLWCCPLSLAVGASTTTLHTHIWRSRCSDWMGGERRRVAQKSNHFPRQMSFLSTSGSNLKHQIGFWKVSWRWILPFKL